ncbi:MAG: hypothetical protein WCR97_04670 [Bacilli bacterium]
MENNTESTNRKLTNKRKRDIYFLLSIILSLVIPIIVACTTFEVDVRPPDTAAGWSLGVGGVICIIIIVLSNLKKVKEYVASLEFSFWKTLLSSLPKLIIMSCFAYLLYMLGDTIKDAAEVVKKLQIVCWTFVGCNTTSLLLTYPLFQYYASESKLDVDFKKWKKRENEAK